MSRGASISPMLATPATEVPGGEGWSFEPKYDGIRILAYMAGDSVTLLSRNGNDKTTQFPEIAEALARIGRRAERDVVLDGEIVALRDGRPARFQQLQSRMHVTEAATIASHRRATPVALVLFDMLVDGDESLLDDPQRARRQHLLQLLTPPVPRVLRVSESVVGDGEAMLARARARGWEGVIAKRRDAPYLPGKRSRAWLKLKLERQQELVVGGFTEPRASRQHLGAILLGYYDAEGRLRYAGHTGGGFSRASLADMYRRLHPLERKTCPFVAPPRTNERPHWVRPQVVVEVKFNEWTADGKLRQPIFLGVRDDKNARDVHREPVTASRITGAA